MPAFNLLSSACFCYKKHDLDGWGDADVAVADDEDGLHQDDDPKLCFPRLTVVVEVVAVVVNIMDALRTALVVILRVFW